MLINTEYYIEYYTTDNKRHFTIYYPTEKIAQKKANSLVEQGYKDVKVIAFRY